MTRITKDDSPDIVSAKLADRDLNRVSAKRVQVTDEQLVVELKDGRTISTPLKWYPRLVHATSAERRNLEIGASGIHWPDLDEDLSYRGMLLGRRDRSNPEFLKFWLDGRKKGKKLYLQDYLDAKRKRKSRKHRSQI